jgi:hypothetical protein
MALLQKAYLGATPLFRNVDWFEDGAYQIVTAAASTTTITANTSAHTKGSWSELIESSGQGSVLVLRFTNISSTGANTATLVDIATGASGSETAILSNLAVGATTWEIHLPFKIASGTRFAARIQSVVTGGKTAAVQATVVDAGDYATAPTSLDVINAGDTATSQGTSFSGASGTWSQATATTSQAYRAVGIILSAHDATLSNILGTYELGIGASGSEVVFGSLRNNYNANEQSVQTTPFIATFGRAIPAGSRLAVKHPIGTNPDRYGFTLIGIP